MSIETWDIEPEFTDLAWEDELDEDYPYTVDNEYEGWVFWGEDDWQEDDDDEV